MSDRDDDARTLANDRAWARHDEWMNRNQERMFVNRERTAQPAPPTAEVLDFEAKWPTGSHRKDDAIRRTFNGMTPTRYHQILNRVIDTPEALEHNPMLVHRLLEQREKRTSERASRTFQPTR